MAYERKLNPDFSIDRFQAELDRASSRTERTYRKIRQTSPVFKKAKKEDSVIPEHYNNLVSRDAEGLQEIESKVQKASDKVSSWKASQENHLNKLNQRVTGVANLRQLEQREEAIGSGAEMARRKALLEGELDNLDDLTPLEIKVAQQAVNRRLVKTYSQTEGRGTSELSKDKTIELLRSQGKLVGGEKPLSDDEYNKYLGNVDNNLRWSQWFGQTADEVKVEAKKTKSYADYIKEARDKIHIPEDINTDKYFQAGLNEVMDKTYNIYKDNGRIREYSTDRTERTQARITSSVVGMLGIGTDALDYIKTVGESAIRKVKGQFKGDEWYYNDLVEGLRDESVANGIWDEFRAKIESTQRQMADISESDEWRSLSNWEKLKPENLLETATNISPSIVSSLVLMAGTGSAGFIAMGASEANSIYEEATSMGYTGDSALTISAMAGAISSALEKIGFNKITGQGMSKNVAAKFAKRIVLKGLETEMTTEGLQELTNGLLRKVYNEDLEYDEIGSSVAMAMFGGLLTDATFGGVAQGLNKVNERMYTAHQIRNDINNIYESALMSGNTIISQIDPKADGIAAKAGVMSDMLVDKKAESNSASINPLDAIKAKEEGPIMNPNRDTKILNNIQEASSVRTGDAVYVNGRDSDVKILPDVLGTERMELDILNVRRMKYDEAVNYIQDQLETISDDSKELILEPLNKSEWSLPEVTKAFGLLTRINKGNEYTGVLIDNDGEAMVQPIAMERDAEMMYLETASRLMTESLRFNKRNIKKKLREMYKAKNMNMSNKMFNLQLDNMTKAFQAMDVALNADKDTKGYNMNWEQAKKFFNHMAGRTELEVNMLQNLLSEYMDLNPQISDTLTLNERKTIRKGINNLVNAKKLETLRKKAGEMVAKIDEKLKKAEVRAIKKKIIKVKKSRKDTPKLDWTPLLGIDLEAEMKGELTPEQKQAQREGEQNKKRFYELTNGEIKVLKTKATADPTRQNIDEFNKAVSEQNELYKEAKANYKTRKEYEKMERKFIASGAVEKLQKRKKKGAISSAIYKYTKHTTNVYSLMHDLFGDGSYAYDVLAGSIAKGERMGSYVANEVAVISDKYGMTTKQMSRLSYDIKRKKKILNKNLEVTGTDGKVLNLDLAPDELITLYNYGKEGTASYAVIGEKGSDITLTRKGRNTHFVLSKQQLDAVNSMVESDPELMKLHNYMREIFDIYYKYVAPIYKKNTGRDLPKVMNYMPISIMQQIGRHGEGIDLEQQRSFATMDSMINYFKSQRKVKKNLELKGGLNVLNNYISTMDTYIQYSRAVGQAKFLLNNREVRRSIQDVIGNDVYKMLTNFYQVLEKGGASSKSSFKKGLLHKANYIRGKAINSVLWLSPTTPLKQLASYSTAAMVDPNFNMIDLMGNTPAASKMLANNDMRQSLFEAMPMILDRSRTGFQASMSQEYANNSRILQLASDGTSGIGTGWTGKTGEFGTKMIKLTDRNTIAMIAFSYISKQAELAGVDLNAITHRERVQFINKHSKKIDSIIRRSQPMYSKGSRAFAMQDYSGDVLAQMLLTFKTATLAQANAVRTNLINIREGKINKKAGLANIAGALTTSAAILTTVHFGYQGVKGIVSSMLFGDNDDDEKEQSLKLNIFREMLVNLTSMGLITGATFNTFDYAIFSGYEIDDDGKIEVKKGVEKRLMRGAAQNSFLFDAIQKVTVGDEPWGDLGGMAGLIKAPYDMTVAMKDDKLVEQTLKTAEDLIDVIDLAGGINLERFIGPLIDEALEEKPEYIKINK